MNILLSAKKSEWIVFLEGSQSIHGEVSYPQIQNTTALLPMVSEELVAR